MKKLNKNEEIARMNIIGAFNWIVGGYYNSIQDGNADSLPESVDILKGEIYSSAVNNYYLIGGAEFIGRSPREMRFCGREFIKSVIEELCKSDSDFDTVVEHINSR